GPQPGAGRPPSVVRAASRQAYDERIPILATIADDKNAEAKDRIAAIKALGAFGLSGAVSADDVRERLLATLTEIRAYLPMEQAEQLIARIRAHWMTTA
ncbi:MAG TPA: hypothetical protein VN085_12185, partial [Vicinamibacterales bacterium]|nr:hypothetical protein [Vicinamibacterales bacterium]